MTVDERINAFVELGSYLKQVNETENIRKYPYLFKELQHLINQEKNYNNFYTPENILLAINGIADNLTRENLTEWLTPYREKLQIEKHPVRIGVIMAGNIPMVGFHDMLSVLISGNIFVGKRSSDDVHLLPHLVEVLIQIEPKFKSFIYFTDRLSDVAAIIATGGNNSGRYFDFYFSKYPHVIRRNRNSVAVLSGLETKEEFVLLGKDIFQYFGLGCRSVSKIYVPENYNFVPFFEAIEEYSTMGDYNKYRNNYDYNKSILLVNKVHHLDNGFLLVKEDTAMVSPISVLFYEFYKDKALLEKMLDAEAEKLQCIVSKQGFIKNAIPFGSTQCPALWDYADKVDTLQFLLDLN